MESHHDEEIERIISGFSCPKGFVCYKSGFVTLCKAADIGFDPFLECFEEAAQECAFSLSCANIHFCDCPLRFYIAKKLQK